jgi:hypothetical protein
MTLPKITLADLPKELPFLWAEYDCKDGSGHTHCVGGDIFEDGIEGTAELLASAVEHCEGHVDKYGISHAFPHPEEEVQNAYHIAVATLLTDSAQRVYAELRQRIARYEKWGGHVPEAIMMPSKDDPNKWDMIVVDPRTAEPHYVEMDQSVMREMPDPREFGAKPDPVAGWKMPRRRKKHG